MGGTGDPPVPVGDPLTGMTGAQPWEFANLFASHDLSIPSGESPDGTGQWPVLPNRAGIQYIATFALSGLPFGGGNDFTASS